MRSVLFIFINLAMLACAAPLRLFVTIAPQREIVQRVAGSDAQVTVLVPPGMSPENFSPDARTLNALSRADFYFTIGIASEDAMLPKLQRLNRALRIIAPSPKLNVRNFAPPGEGRDPHLWLDADNIHVMAMQVVEVLTAAHPEEAAQYRARAEQYCKQIKASDEQIAAILAPLRGRVALVYHPAFAYFFERYGMRQLPIELEGKEPPGGYLGKVVREARNAQCPVLFVQPQVNERAVRTISSEVGCGVCVLDPLPAVLSDGLLKLARTVADAYGLK